MGIVIGLIFALGCLSILAACTSEPNLRLTRLNEAMERNLRQAGVGKTSPGGRAGGGPGLFRYKRSFTDRLSVCHDHLDHAGGLDQLQGPQTPH